jgi:hypothetical protein
VELEIRRGRAQHRLRPVDGPVFLVGTSPDCDMVLGDLQFPATHLYLLVTCDGVLLRHLGVPPEVTVNGRRVESAVLGNGDRIRTGPFEFAIAIHSGRRPDRPTTSPRTSTRPPLPRRRDVAAAARALRLVGPPPGNVTHVGGPEASHIAKPLHV